MVLQHPMFDKRTVPVTRRRAMPTSQFQETNNTITHTHRVQSRLALDLISLQPLFSRRTFVNDPTQTLTNRQRRHIPNPPPLLDPNQLPPFPHSPLMAPCPHNGVIPLSPQRHSAQEFLSHSRQSSNFVRHSLLRLSAHLIIIATTHSPWCLRLVSRPGMKRVAIIALGYLCRQTDK